jgi:hypothetical protein
VHRYLDSKECRRMRRAIVVLCVSVAVAKPAMAAGQPAAPDILATIAPPWALMATGAPALTRATRTAPLNDDATRCLTEAVYYESAREPRAGKEAVAQVVLNRLRDPVFPKTVCNVVYQGSSRRTGCQFTFTCDGSLGRAPVARLWKEAQDVAEQALGGFVADEVQGALNYHADYVAPRWSRSLVRVTQIGAHIFYRQRGPGDGPAALRALAAAGPSRSPRRTAAAATREFSVWGIGIAAISRSAGVRSVLPPAPPVAASSPAPAAFAFNDAD